MIRQYLRWDGIINDILINGKTRIKVECRWTDEGEVEINSVQNILIIKYNHLENKPEKKVKITKRLRRKKEGKRRTEGNSVGSSLTNVQNFTCH